MIVSRIAPALSQTTNDLMLAADGNLAMVHDAEAVGQHARQRLMTFQGDWFLDTTAGVAWLEEIMGRKSDMPLAEALLKAEILDTDGVTGIAAFSIRYFRAGRRVDVPTASLLTEYDVEADL